MIRTQYFHIDVAPSFHEQGRLPAFVDQVASEICEQLRIPMDPWTTVKVHIGSAPSQASVDELTIEAKRASCRYNEFDWFELLFRHELTHVLIRRHWGCGPPLFWEGLPIHLGDERVRQRLLGVRYRDHCAALLASRSLIVLSRLILPSDYHGLRGDFRVDLQAGAFVGFLLERHPVENLATLFRTYRAPTPDRPWIEIDDLCRAAFGSDLTELQSLWHESLRACVFDANLVERYRDTRFSDLRRNPGRCDYCMSPLDVSGARCVSCMQPTASVTLR